jgi:SAM-dependent methyltransferase
MKASLLPVLACPECEASFTLRTFKESTINGITEIEEGLLTCSSGHWYIIVKYIPRMLPDMLAEFPEFEKRYKDNFPKEKTNTSKKQNEFKELQEKTKESFGFEWEKWNRFGWDDSVPLETTRAIFDYKVLFTPKELAGKLLLDGGCGNGRYSKVAREYGAEVVGIDLSRAIDEAFENFKGDPKAHFVQGDLFKLPFKNKAFDFIFSNGVLMHTGNAKRAFLSLVTKLNDSGIISVHLYHKGNPVYEFNDWWLRVITTRLPLKTVYIFSKILVTIAKILPKKFIMYGLNMFLRIEDHEHYVFDWYTAPIATHHTYPEVYGWLKEANLYLIADHNKTNYPWRKWILPFQFLTVKAQKDPISPEKAAHTTR